MWSVATTKVASELRSSLQGTTEWGSIGLVNFSAEKIQFFSLDGSSNSNAINMKMGISVLEEKLPF